MDEYYPFGLTFQNNNLGLNKYLYNGKEIQDETLGGTFLGLYDYGRRFYDPQIARWHSIDPVIELHHDYTPYAYVYNNPMRFIDPNGLDSADRAKLVQAAQKYVDNNPGGTYGYNPKNRTPTAEEVKKGAKVDCAGMVRGSQNAAGNGNPETGKKGTLGDNAVAIVVEGTEEKTVNQLEDGNYVTFKTNRSEHKGPDGKYDHIGVAENVQKDANGNVTSFDVIHSYGSGSTSGPMVTGYTVSDPKSWLTLKGVYKWDVTTSTPANSTPAAAPASTSTGGSLGSGRNGNPLGLTNIFPNLFP